MSETSQMNYDVIISGLGPTGLTLANILGQNGLQVLILEREQTYYGNARAGIAEAQELAGHRP